MFEALPESVSAAIRYAIALIATLTGALSESDVVTISGAVITVATVAYGIYRTYILEETVIALDDALFEGEFPE